MEEGEEEEVEEEEGEEAEEKEEELKGVHGDMESAAGVNDHPATPFFHHYQ